MSDDKVDRVSTVLAGQRPDRPPVSFWYHFERDQRYGPQAVRAHLDHQRTYDLDFLKVMNDNGYPAPTAIRTLDDLAALTPLQGDEPQFARQLELLEALAKELAGTVLMATTIFNPWATLRRLIQPKDKPGPPSLTVAESLADRSLGEFLHQDRSAVAGAVKAIGQSLARFAAHCIEAGADGIFLSVRDDWVDTPENGAGTYDEINRSADLKIVAAVADARFNLIHVCGRALDFEAFARYPVHAVNWADRAAGPAIAEVRDRLGPAICGGVDNLETLPHGTPRQCAEQVRDAMEQAGDRPILIAPGCTYDPQQVPPANLVAVCDAARAG